MKVSKLKSLAALGGLGLSAFAPSLYAQAALEEVIVTAQKKAESLQDTPISLTAFSEDRLEVEGISSLG